MSTPTSARSDGRALGGVPAEDAVFSITITEGGAPPAQDAVKQGPQAAPDTAYAAGGDGSMREGTNGHCHDGHEPIGPQGGAPARHRVLDVSPAAAADNNDELSIPGAAERNGHSQAGGAAHKGGAPQPCEGATCHNGDGLVDPDGGPTTPLPRFGSSIALPYERGVTHGSGQGCEGASSCNGDGLVHSDGGSTAPLPRRGASTAMTLPYERGVTHGSGKGCEGASSCNGDRNMDLYRRPTSPRPRDRSSLSTAVPHKAEGGATNTPLCEGASSCNGDRNNDLYRGATGPQPRQETRDDDGDMGIVCEGASCHLHDAIIKIMAVEAFEHPPARSVAGGAGEQQADADPAYEGSAAGETRSRLVGDGSAAPGSAV